MVYRSRDIHPRREVLVLPLISQFTDVSDVWVTHRSSGSRRQRTRFPLCHCSCRSLRDKMIVHDLQSSELSDIHRKAVRLAACITNCDVLAFSSPRSNVFRFRRSFPMTEWFSRIRLKPLTGRLTPSTSFPSVLSLRHPSLLSNWRLIIEWAQTCRSSSLQSGGDLLFGRWKSISIPILPSDPQRSTSYASTEAKLMIDPSSLPLHKIYDKTQGPSSKPTPSVSTHFIHQQPQHRHGPLLILCCNGPAGYDAGFDHEATYLHNCWLCVQSSHPNSLATADTSRENPALADTPAAWAISANNRAPGQEQSRGSSRSLPADNCLKLQAVLSLATESGPRSKPCYTSKPG